MRRRKQRASVLKALAKAFLGLVIAVVFAVLLTGFVKYPEKYLSTWRYQLKCDIEQGDEDAIRYYETNYVANGIDLFGEE